MRNLTFSLALTLAATFTLTTSTQANPNKNTNWTQFSHALTEAIHYPNAGVQMGAIQQIARYGDQLELSDETIFEIVRIYRSSNDENVRILALMALGKTNDVWAMDFLKRSARFEDSARVLKHTRAVVQAYEHTKAS